MPAGAAETYKADEAVHLTAYDTTKEKGLFGIDLIDKEQSVRDMVAIFENKGWWPKKN